MTVVATTDEVDPVSNDMVIDILPDEQRHRRPFEGFLREYSEEGAGAPQTHTKGGI
jgi:bacterioferritin